MTPEIILDVPSSAAGRRLSDWLLEQGIPFRADCGGRGTCGKCKVTVLEGEFLRSASAEPYLPDERGEILSCRALCTDRPARIRAKLVSGQGLTAHAVQDAPGERANFSLEERYGVALDIGTTTLAAALVDRQTGETLKTCSSLNPQQRFGADVINRILACRNGHLGDLTGLIRKETAALLSTLSAEIHDKQIHTLTVAGNPTMLHLFCGVSPEGMGAYPFTPAFTDTQRLTGSETGIPVQEIIALPSASAFIGSDILGGVLSCGLAERHEPSVLVDLGTNGEIVFSCGGRLLAASTAAGPALEGANISCGMGGVAGAVNSVTLSQEGAFLCTTIGDAPPAGLCGSGLVDLIAALLNRGDLDETGYLDDDVTLGTLAFPAFHVRADGSHTNEPLSAITLTQKDVREFQLAKSAIRAGLTTLTEQAGEKLEQLGAVYLAGGLGFYINTESAVRVGMLPECLAGRVRPVGNTSLAGATLCLCHAARLAELETLASRCQTIDLNQVPTFSDCFVEHMLFPE